MDNAEKSQTRKGVGALLKQTREQKQLTLEDIAHKTRIQKVHLEAIEADALDRLPAGPFAEGFVSSYTRALGLNPDEVLGLLPEGEATHVNEHTFEDTGRRDTGLELRELPVGGGKRPFPLWLAGAASILVVLVLFALLPLKEWLGWLPEPLPGLLQGDAPGTAPGADPPPTWAPDRAAPADEESSSGAVGDASAADSGAASGGERASSVGGAVRDEVLGEPALSAQSDAARLSRDASAAPGAAVALPAAAGTAAAAPKEADSSLMKPGDALPAGGPDAASLSTGSSAASKAETRSGPAQPRNASSDSTGAGAPTPLQRLAPIVSERDKLTYEVFTDPRHSSGQTQRVVLVVSLKSHIRVSQRLDALAPDFEAVLQPGQSKQLSFKQDLWVTLGNAGGVEVFYNDERVGFVGADGERKGVAFRAANTP